MILTWQPRTAFDESFARAFVGTGAGGNVITVDTGMAAGGLGVPILVGTYPSGGGGPVNQPVAIKVFIASVDRTAWITHPIRRSWEVGSVCTCSFSIESALAGVYRPAELDEVVILLGSYLYFRGTVDTYSEKYHGGAGQTFEIKVNCQGWAAMLEKTFAGIDVNTDAGQLSQLMAILFTYLQDIPIYTALGPSADAVIARQTFNWLSISQLMRTICDQLNRSFIVDMSPTLWVFHPDDGIGAAPFQITDTNGPNTAAGNTPDWQNIEITRGGLYRNSQGVRNSQQLKPTSATTDPDGIITQDSSRLSYIAWAQDAGEQTSVGYKVEAISDARDIQSIDTLADMAQTLLDQGVKHAVRVVLECVRNGLEPGQILTLNTSIPPINDALLIEHVESETQSALADGTVLVRHVVTASNTTFRRGAGIAALTKLTQAANVPAIDRVSKTYVFTLAETIEGITNPGLSAGLKPLKLSVVMKSVARDVTFEFKTGPASTDVIVDILQNSVSIFASGQKPTIKAGSTRMVATDYAFLSAPMNFEEGDTLEIDVLAADATAMDGTFQLTLMG